MAGHKEVKKEETQARISVLIYVLAAVAVGFASLTLSAFVGNMFTVFLALVFAWLTGKIVQAVLGKKETKWLLGNGMFIYLFVWLISWIFFFNLLNVTG